jgi:hypothetical protein
VFVGGIDVESSLGADADINLVRMSFSFGVHSVLVLRCCRSGALSAVAQASTLHSSRTRTPHPIPSTALSLRHASWSQAVGINFVGSHPASRENLVTP